MERVKFQNIEYVTASFSELDEEMRCDAEYFLGTGLNDKPSRTGRSSIVFSQYGTSKELNEEGHGYPILRLNEFENCFLGTPRKNCAIISERTFDSFKVKQHDVLICRTNGNPKLVGKAAVSLRDEQFGFASYLFRVRTDEKFILPAALTAYLNSKYGRGEIEKFSMVSNQANFSPAKFRKIKIPVLPLSIQNFVSESIKEAYRSKHQSNKCYLEAEEILFSQLGLTNWKVKSKVFKQEGVQLRTENTINSNVSLNDMFMNNRLDAEFWQPRFLEAEKMLMNNGKFRPLSELAKLRKGSQARSAETLTSGIPYASIKDCDNLEVATTELTNRANPITVASGEIVFAITGATIGKTAINNTSTPIAISGDLLGIFTNDLPKNYLLVVLASRMIQDLAKRFTTGATNGHLAIRDVAKFPIPIIDKKSMKKIEDKMNTYFEQRIKCRELIEASKMAIEIFIETNEKTAVRYIKSHSI